MNAMINLTQADIGGTSVQTVNARDLHGFLEVGKVFGTWITDRIAQYGFTEGVDYILGVNPEIGKNPMGGRPTKDYHISLDMAKELAMVERNEKGKQARQYFIEMERRAKSAPAFDPMKFLADPDAVRGLLLTYTERVIALEAKVTELGDKGKALDLIATADGSLTLTDAAKALQMQPKGLIDWLVRNQWIYKRIGSTNYLGYQSKTSIGMMEHKTTTINRADGSEKITTQVRITAKGLARLAHLIKLQDA